MLKCLRDERQDMTELALEKLSFGELVSAIIFHKPGPKNWNSFHDATLPKAVAKAAETHLYLRKLLEEKKETDGLSAPEISSALEDALANMSIWGLLNTSGDFRNHYINFACYDSSKKLFEKENGEGSWDAMKPVADCVWAEYEKLAKTIPWQERLD